MSIFNRSTRPHTVFVVSLLLHLAVVFALGHYRHPNLWENGGIANNLLAGQGFSSNFSLQIEPTSWQAPGYPYLLVLAWHLFGQTPSAYLCISILQAFAVAAMVYPAGFLTRRWFGETAADWARVITCVMPLYLWYVSRLHQTALVIAIHPWLLWGWLQLKDRTNVRTVIWTGIGTGLAGLFQPVLLAVYGIMAATLAVLAIVRKNRANFAGVIGAGLLTLAVLTPWTVRNYHVHHRLLLIKDSFGKEFWMGNNPHATGTGYAEGGEEEITNAHPPEAFALRGKVSELELMDAMQGEAIDYVKAAPKAFILRTAKKIVWLWTATPSNLTRSTQGGEARQFRLLHLGYWLLFIALAILARVLHGRLSAEYVWLMVLFIVVYSLVYGMTHVGQARFRGEIEFNFIPAVAAGCALIVARVLQFRRL